MPAATIATAMLGLIGARIQSDAVVSERIWHPWLRVERLIRSILKVRRDPMTRPVMKATLVVALKEGDRIRRAGWMN